MNYNWKEITERLNNAIRLTKSPIGIKVFENKSDLDAIQKLRRPKHIHMPCQILGQAIQLGFTIGFTADDLVGDNCASTVGLAPQTETWRKGSLFSGVWCKNEEDAARHHGVLTDTSGRNYEAIVASPLRSERIEPDVCMIVGTPAQIFMLISGYQRKDYKAFDFFYVGESGCSSTWVNTIHTGKVGLSLPCYAELRYGGYSENEVILSLTPDDLVKAVEGLEDLSKVGLRYPIAPYGMQMDVREGVGVSYNDTKK